MKRIAIFKRKKRTLQRIDYRKYHFSVPELLGYAGIGLGIGLIICWLCYHSIYGIGIAALTCMIYLKMKRKSLIENRKRKLLYHFGEFLGALHTALCAGCSVENGIKSTYSDMKQLYGGNDLIVMELQIMLSGLRLRKPVEELFEDLGQRSGLEDIQLFAELLAIAKKQGGSMGKVIADTKKIICEKIETEKEIEKILSAKIYEQKIMSIMPAAVILYLRLTFDGFIEQLYGSLEGVLIMTVCLLIYAGAYFLGRRIVKIEV